MIKKTVTYKNLFTGEDVTKDLYFHLEAAEVTKMAIRNGDGWLEHMQTLSKKQDGATIIEEMEKMLATAYGEREGDDIIKSPEISARFIRSQAYNTLFMELITSEDSGGEFFGALIPKDLDAYVEKLKNNPALAKASEATDPTDKRPAWVRENRKPTQAELKRMTKEEMAEAFRAQLDS